ncbi:hypothetical protein ABBQ38_011078 [Trebouxia sp. C0009 RCD-2024]
MQHASQHLWEVLAFLALLLQILQELDGVEVEPVIAADLAQGIPCVPISLPMDDCASALHSTVEKEAAEAAAKELYAFVAAAAAAVKEAAAAAAKEPHAAAEAAAGAAHCSLAVAKGAAAAAIAQKQRTVAAAAAAAAKVDEEQGSVDMTAVQSADEEGPQSLAPQEGVLTALPQE